MPVNTGKLATEFGYYNQDPLVHLPGHVNETRVDRVLVQIGTQVIDQFVITMTEKELQKAGDTWK